MGGGQRTPCPISVGRRVCVNALARAWRVCVGTKGKRRNAKEEGNEPAVGDCGREGRVVCGEGWRTARMADFGGPKSTQQHFKTQRLGGFKATRKAKQRDSANTKENVRSLCGFSVPYGSVMWLNLHSRCLLAKPSYDMCMVCFGLRAF